MATAETLSSETNYRAVSPWAIAALVAGVASALALINPLLYLVPLVAIFLGLRGLAIIHKNRDAMSGEGVALVGLFLASFFLVFSPTRIQLRQQHLLPTATEFSERVMELLRTNRLHELHNLSSRKFVGVDPARPLSEYYGESKTATELLQKFLQGGAIQQVTQLGGEFDTRLLQIQSYQDRGVDGFVARFEIQPRRDASKKPFSIWIVSERVVEGQSPAVWWLRAIHTQDPYVMK